MDTWGAYGARSRADRTGQPVGMEHEERSELPDPADGGAGLNEGASQGDADRGGPARDEPVPQGGGALGGRADPIAGSAGEDDG